jgi:hypothetical protein
MRTQNSLRFLIRYLYFFDHFITCVFCDTFSVEYSSGLESISPKSLPD